MNKEALLAVADVIEYMDRFDMSVVAATAGSGDNIADPVTIWEDCGMVGCIAGWTMAWADIHADLNAWPRDYNEEAVWIKNARKELGLTKRQAEELFYPDSQFWAKTVGTHTYCGGWETNNDITTADAVKALRELAVGEIKL